MLSYTYIVSIVRRCASLIRRRATSSGSLLEQVMGHVVACGTRYGSDEHFVATEVFVKKDRS